MREYIELGPTPSEEAAAQLGKDGYRELATIETRAYKAQLRRMFPKASDMFGIKGFDHDFGTYYEVVVYYDGNSDEQGELAFNVENNIPSHWDEEARAELASKGYNIEKPNPKKSLPARYGLRFFNRKTGRQEEFLTHSKTELDRVLESGLAKGLIGLPLKIFNLASKPQWVPITASNPDWKSLYEKAKEGAYKAKEKVKAMHLDEKAKKAWHVAKETGKSAYATAMKEMKNPQKKWFQGEVTEIKEVPEYGSKQKGLPRDFEVYSGGYLLSSILYPHQFDKEIKKGDKVQFGVYESPSGRVLIDEVRFFSGCQTEPSGEY